MAGQQRWIVLTALGVLGLSLYFLSAVLTPFLISFLLAYLGNSLVERCRRVGLPRPAAVYVVFAFTFLTIISFFLIIIPLFFEQLKALTQLLPVWDRWLQTHIWPFLQNYFDLDPQLFDIGHIARETALRWQKATGVLTYLGLSFTRSSMMLISFLVNVFLIPVVTFYLLRDWKKIIANSQGLLPQRWQSSVIHFVQDCDLVVAAFFKGQLLVMLALGAIYSIGLSLVGLKFAILIGLVAGAVSIIPYMGFIVGFSSALLVALFQFGGTWALAGVVAVFLIGQALEGFILVPHLVGDSLGLHPVAVIFSLMAGGHLFGMTGMLIALPLAAIIVVLLRHLRQNHGKHRFYHVGSNE